MITREETDAQIAEIRASDHIADDAKQELIDEALTKEANQLETGHVLSIAQSFSFGMLLMGVLIVIKYALPLLIL